MASHGLASKSAGNQGPHLRKTSHSSQLIVKGEPFLIFGAEIHNSTFSRAQYAQKTWPLLKSMNVNTVLAPVTWEGIEPAEGTFDFDELDKCILAARSHGLHLVLLWFGAYKNAMSTYAPSWVRTDVKRFPRIHLREAGGRLKTVDILQPYVKDAWEADAKAFAMLMRHVKKFDSEHSTVIMVQVENEIGVMGDSRDGSAIAETLFATPVPQGLLGYLQREYGNLHPTFRNKFPHLQSIGSHSQTWAQAFGTGIYAEDLFMADAFSRFVQKVTAAGRAEYDIPMYVNVALCSEEPHWADYDFIPAGVPEGEKPGEYPTGGPVGHNLDVYKYNAPDVAFYAPDIYLQEYETLCECYRYQDQPLFIPEQRRDSYGARRMWSAYGNYLAIGCSPFGADSLAPDTAEFSLHFKLLNSIRKHILDAQATRPDDIMGFFFDEIRETKKEKTWVKSMGNFEVTVSRAVVFGKPDPAAGMIIRQSNGKFLVVGFAFQVSFKSKNPKSTFTGILSAEELQADDDGNLSTVRILNGDETQHGCCLVMPSKDPQFDGFPIPFMMPAGTMIAQCMPYSLEETEDDM